MGSRVVLSEAQAAGTAHIKKIRSKSGFRVLYRFKFICWCPIQSARCWVGIRVVLGRFIRACM